MTATIRPAQLTCEMLVDPLGVTARAPRLSWIVRSERRAQSQRAYQILVAESAADLAEGRGTLWDSGRVEAACSRHIAYAGRPLRSNQTCYWKVRVWDTEDRASAYSAPALWQMGLLAPQDWRASWIGLDAEPQVEFDGNPAAYLRRKFTLKAPVVRATLYATAKGVYIPTLNGERVGDLALAPGWTDYHKRIHVQTYDVTERLREGENVLGLIVGDGWYSGHLGFTGTHRYYGDHPRALCQLVIEHEGAPPTVIVTDGAWQASLGPILYSDIQMGEIYDARRELPEWDRPDGADGDHWTAPLVEPLDDPSILVSQPDQPVRIIESIEPVAVTEQAPGVFIFDLGQNIAGWARLRVSGPAGTRVQLRFGEMLEPDGSLHTANLRSARATDIYILKGEGQESYEPHFVYHGFRYVEVTGYPGIPSLEAITGRVIHNAMPFTGHFECSDPRVNRLWQNILWGQRGNFVSVPTDCPQRDERLGWTGDAQIFCRTASFNMDVSAFFTKWLADMRDTQTEDGAYTDIAPQINGMPKAAPGWGDAGVIIPWILYRVYGDTRLIEEHYPSMRSWMDYIAVANPFLLRTKRLHSNYSDWVSLETGTSSEQIATAYWAKMARMMADMASVIGREGDAQEYRELFDALRDAYRTAYVNPDGRIEGQTQTAYVLALDNDLLPEALRPAAADHLMQALARHNHHLATGFLGTPPLCFVLAEHGHLDAAYGLLMQDTYPSWLYMVANGATTMWERWNAYTVEGGIHDPGMNSFNHYAYGSIGEWLYRVVLGIDAGAPGYKHILLRPRPGGGLRYAKGHYDSAHGRIVSAWRIDDEGTHYTLEVPANTTATLELPTAYPYSIREGGAPAEEAEGVRFLRYERGAAVFALESGAYAFSTEDLAQTP